MTIADLNPDVVLAEMLDKKVEVQTSATDKHTIKCYADNKQPNKNLDDEFINILWNGGVKARTSPPGCFKGDLALSILCKAQTDNTAKTQRVRQIMRQCQMIASGITKSGFYFSVDPSQLITPTVVNKQTGYSTTTINVKWRTIN